MKNIFAASMKVKLVTLFLVISLVPLMIVSVTSYISAKKALEKGFIESFKAISQGREEAVKRYLRTKIKVTTSYATDVFIRNTLEKIEQHGLDMGALVKDLDEYLVEDKGQIDSDTEMTSIMNPEGKIVASTDKTLIGVDKSKDQYFVEGKSGMHIKDPYVSSTGKDCIAVSMPIKSKATGAFIGVVVNRYETKELNHILADRVGLGDTGEVYMLNGGGYMITDSRFTKDTFLKQKVDSDLIKIFRSEKKESTGLYKDYRGLYVLGVTNGVDLDQEFGLG